MHAIRLEFRATTIMCFQYFAMPCRTREFQPQRRDRVAGTISADRQNPRKADVDEHRRLRPSREQKDEFHDAFALSGVDTDLFRAGELFVARHSLQRIKERPAVKCRNGRGIVALDTGFRAELEPDSRVTA